MRVIRATTKIQREDEIILTGPTVELTFETPIQAKIFACTFEDPQLLAEYLTTNYNSVFETKDIADVTNDIFNMLVYKTWKEIQTYGDKE